MGCKASQPREKVPLEEIAPAAKDTTGKTEGAPDTINDTPKTDVPDQVHGERQRGVKQSVVTAAPPAATAEQDAQKGGAAAADQPDQEELPLNPADLEIRDTASEVDSTREAADGADETQSESTLEVTRIGRYLSDSDVAIAACRGKKVLVLLGATGAGKSTLVNFIRGKQLVWGTRTKQVEDREVTQTGWDVQEDEQDNLFQVGHFRESQTRCFQHFDIGRDEVVLDSPGYGDTEFTEVDFSISIGFQRIFQACNAMRFVCLVQFQQMRTSRGKHWVDMTKFIDRLFDFQADNNKLCVTFLFTHQDGNRGRQAMLNEVRNELGMKANKISIVKWLVQVSDPSSEHGRLVDVFRRTVRNDLENCASDISQLLEDETKWGTPETGALLVKFKAAKVLDEFCNNLPSQRCAELERVQFMRLKDMDETVRKQLEAWDFTASKQRISQFQAPESKQLLHKFLDDIATHLKKQHEEHLLQVHSAEHVSLALQHTKVARDQVGQCFKDAGSSRFDGDRMLQDLLRASTQHVREQCEGLQSALKGSRQSEVLEKSQVLTEYLQKGKEWLPPKEQDLIRRSLDTATKEMKAEQAAAKEVLRAFVDGFVGSKKEKAGEDVDKVLAKLASMEQTAPHSDSERKRYEDSQQALCDGLRQKLEQVEAVAREKGLPDQLLSDLFYSEQRKRVADSVKELQALAASKGEASAYAQEELLWLDQALGQAVRGKISACERGVLNAESLVRITLAAEAAAFFSTLKGVSSSSSAGGGQARQALQLRDLVAKQSKELEAQATTKFKETAAQLRTALQQDESAQEAPWLFLRHFTFVELWPEAAESSRKEIQDVHQALRARTEREIQELFGGQGGHKGLLASWEFGSVGKHLESLREMAVVITGVFGLYKELSFIKQKAPDEHLNRLGELRAKSFGTAALWEMGGNHARLGLTQAAHEEITAETLRAAKESLSKIYHPDGGGAGRLQDLQKRVSSAYDALQGDPPKYGRDLKSVFQKHVEAARKELTEEVAALLKNSAFERLATLHEKLGQGSFDTWGVTAKEEGAWKQLQASVLVDLKKRVHKTSDELTRLLSSKDIAGASSAYEELEKMDTALGHLLKDKAEWNDPAHTELVGYVRQHEKLAKDLVNKYSKTTPPDPEVVGLELVYIGRTMHIGTKGKFLSEAQRSISSVLALISQKPWGLKFIFNLGMLLEQGKIGDVDQKDPSQGVVSTDKKVAKQLVDGFSQFNSVRDAMFNKKCRDHKDAKQASEAVESKRRRSGSAPVNVTSSSRELMAGFNYYDRLQLQYFKDWSSGKMSKKALAEEIIKLAATHQPAGGLRSWGRGLRDKIPVLLAGISAFYTITKSGESYKALVGAKQGGEGDKTLDGDKGMDKMTVLKKLHSVQVLTILRLFGYDVGGGSPANHMVEVKTGEGKSIILGISALLFGLLGFKVWCVCYSKELSSRDWADFRPLFEAFGVADRVNYGKITEFSEDRVAKQGDIRMLTGSLIQGGLAAAAASRVAQTPASPSSPTAVAPAERTAQAPVPRASLTTGAAAAPGAQTPSATAAPSPRVATGAASQPVDASPSPAASKPQGAASPAQAAADHSPSPAASQPQGAASPAQAAGAFTFPSLFSGAFSFFGAAWPAAVGDTAADQGTLLPPLRSTAEEILLVDEVDVFFGSDFYGATHKQTSQLQADEVSEILRNVWAKHKSKTATQAPKTADQVFAEICASDAYKQLLKKIGSKWEPLLQTELRLMASDVFLWQESKYYYDAATGRIGYKHMDTIDYNITYGYRTTFAMMHEVLSKKSAGQHELNALQEALSLRVLCGVFSYANINPNRILGVSGTLSILGDEDWEVLNSYGVEMYTAMPSVFRVKSFQWHETMKVMGMDIPGIMLVENEEALFQTLTRQMDELRREGRAVLVFFRDASALCNFKNSRELTSINQQGIEVLQESSEDKSGIIRRAAECKHITLCTRIFGRGTDFTCFDEDLQQKGGVHVIQLFVSEDESEEVQIKGRTARQGEYGSYSLLLLKEELMKFLGGAVPKKGFDDVKAQIQEARKKRRAEVAKERKDSLAAATVADQHSEKYLKALVKGRAPEAATLLLELYKLHVGGAGTISGGAFNIVLCLDASGSMGGDPWNQLLNAVNNFLSQLIVERKGAPDKVSLVTFDGSAKVVLTCESAANAKGTSIPYTGGGTQFMPPLNSAQQILQSKAKESLTPLIVFMSDGHNGDGDAPVRALRSMRTSFPNLVFYAVMLGVDSSPMLNEMAEAMKGKVLVAESALKLEGTFKEIASEITFKA